MKTVAELLRTKSNTFLYSVDADDSLLDGLRIMAEKGVGALVVLSGGRMVGIVSERDYVRKVALADRSMLDAKVNTIMTREVISVSPRDNLQYCISPTAHREAETAKAHRG